MNNSEIKNLLNSLGNYNINGSEKRAIPTIDSINLSIPKITIPKDLANISTINKYERILHSFGQSQPDSIRTFQSDFKNAPDVISYPQNEKDLVKLFEYCDKFNVALIPYGAG